MKRMLSGIISALVLAASFGVANAADMALKAAPPPAAPAWNWSGFYLGIEGGGGWARSQQTDTAGTTSGTYNQSGGLFGFTAGYNWQAGNIVAGVEGDWSWARINGSVTLPGLCTAGGGSVCFTNMRSFGTARARIGMLTPSGQFLFYVTGGAAGANIRAGQQSCSTPIVGAIASCGTANEWAPVVGAGVEAMLAPHWSGKVEYLYTSFGTHLSYTVFIPVNVSEKNVNIVRAGINYHF
jgi:outer membrane immunogenic protein